MQKQRINIAFLQETHLVKSDTNHMSNCFFHVLACSSASNKSKGVAIICQRNLCFKVLDTWADNKGRITVAKVHIENRDVALVSIYAPNTFKKEFYEQITKVLLELSGFKFIIGADFNAVVDYSVDRLGNSENLNQKYASEALCSWINDTGVVDLWHILNLDVKGFTHLSSRHIFLSY